MKENYQMHFPVSLPKISLVFRLVTSDSIKNTLAMVEKLEELEQRMNTVQQSMIISAEFVKPHQAGPA